MEFDFLAFFGHCFFELLPLDQRFPVWILLLASLEFFLKLFHIFIRLQPCKHGLMSTTKQLDFLLNFLVRLSIFSLILDPIFQFLCFLWLSFWTFRSCTVIRDLPDVVLFYWRWLFLHWFSTFSFWLLFLHQLLFSKLRKHMLFVFLDVVERLQWHEVCHNCCWTPPWSCRNRSVSIFSCCGLSWIRSKLNRFCWLSALFFFNHHLFGDYCLWAANLILSCCFG